jgi:uncharacterized protein
MSVPEDALLLRIFIGEDDKYEGRPLYRVIVEAARKKDLAGATVFRGPLGFGKSSRLHTAKILRLSEDLPLVIEIVDASEKIEAFVKELDGIVGGGLVTIEKVRVVKYSAGEDNG